MNHVRRGLNQLGAISFREFVSENTAPCLFHMRLVGIPRNQLRNFPAIQDDLLGVVIAGQLHVIDERFFPLVRGHQRMWRTMNKVIRPVIGSTLFPTTRKSAVKMNRERGDAARQ